MSTSEKQTDLAAAFLERMIPLGKAASLLGIDTRSLRRWLEGECGLVFPRLKRGSSLLVKITDIQTVIARRQGRQKYSGQTGLTRRGGSARDSILETSRNPKPEIPDSKLQAGGAS